MVNRFVRKYIWNNTKGYGVNLKMTIEDNGIDSYRLKSCYITSNHRNFIIIKNGLTHDIYNSPYLDIMFNGLDTLDYKIQVDLMNCFIAEMIHFCEN